MIQLLLYEYVELLRQFSGHDGILKEIIYYTYVSVILKAVPDSAFLEHIFDSFNGCKSFL